MTKKHFIALAKTVIEHNRTAEAQGLQPFGASAIEALADFCAAQNPNFNRERWLGYIAGENGPSGGAR